MNGAVDTTQEMLALSLCNVAGSLVQSMPTTGAFTRSAVASASGIRTPIAGLYAGQLTIVCHITPTEFQFNLFLLFKIVMFV